MTALNAPTRRVATALALAAGAALTLSACGAGQISQTATQVAAINGNGGNVGQIALRNVHVIYPNSEEFSLEPGGKAALGFSIVNLDPYTADTLTGISTDFAAAATGADALTIPAGGSVVAGLPPAEAAEAQELVVDESPKPAGDEEEPDTSVPVAVELTGLKEGVRPGLTIPVTFTFAEAGDVTISVPVDAGPVLERHESDKSPVVAEGH
ncbi:hypothetical protein ACFWDA_19435 [Rhodococcus zopfii]|uniref:Lipoprotein LpqE n=1 Tax=Rhodococcus zopfii TaxID=43772 RepID=A0ABU3WSV6_9NOCA|nr:hypothetical protein [Rhodococcus zopfii]MDV2477003.1 hypothetical protein [Rhodococcus zopfii]